MAKPGNADPFADLQAFHCGAHGVYPADDLMPGNDGQFRIGEFAIDDVEVGAAHTAGEYPYANFVGARLTIGQIGPLERRPQFLKYHRLHIKPRAAGV
jgi:hypothetical protein